MWIYSTDSVALVTDQRSCSMFNCSCSPGICQGLPPECPCVTRKCWVFSGKCFRRSGAQERSLWRFGFTAHSLKSELGWLSYCIRLFVSCRVSAWWTYSIFPNIFLNFVDLKKLCFFFFSTKFMRRALECQWLGLHTILLQFCPVMFSFGCFQHICRLPKLVLQLLADLSVSSYTSNRH